jgi:hypothetical protein
MLAPGWAGGKSFVATAAGTRSLSPFGGFICDYMRRDPAAFGGVWMGFPRPRPRVGGGQIRLLRPPQVSGYLFLAGVYSTDLNDGNRAHAGRISCDS